MKTGFYTNPIFLEHDTGFHPENANRLRSIEEKLKSEGFLEKLKVYSGRSATLSELLMLHSKRLISEVEDASNDVSKNFNFPDCIVSKQTYDAALYAVGSVLDAALEVAERKCENAFCAVRPPGHHAEHDYAMGFCFFNNIALTAEFLTKKMGFERILIFDFDVHHGNGTQHFFEERSDIFFVSMHQDPLSCYPGTGFTHEKGSSVGKGYTLNVPVMSGTGDAEYLQMFYTKVKPVLFEYNPDYVLISAGFDAHRDDPLASLELTEKTFIELTKELKYLAHQKSGGRILSLLEGGYNLNALSKCVIEHLRVLQSDNY